MIVLRRVPVMEALHIQVKHDSLWEQLANAEADNAGLPRDAIVEIELEGSELVIFVVEGELTPCPVCKTNRVAVSDPAHSVGLLHVVCEQCGFCEDCDEGNV